MDKNPYTVELPEDPYAAQIRLFIQKEFPHFGGLNTADVLNLVSDAIISTGQLRYGPKPSPESQVAIRAAISHWIGRSRPIPFLVPWGSEKPNGSGVDVAELFALRSLKALNDRVKEHYAPGVQFVIRLEDVSAPHLFYERMEQARIDANLYTEGFQNLVQVLGMRSFVEPMKESSRVDEATFNATADKYVHAMQEHIVLPDCMRAIDTLKEAGWTNALTPETTGFYLKQYEKLYPTESNSKRVYRLARYFAGALARIKLGITGYNPTWEKKNLELSFAPSAPGIPLDRALRRLTYRTLPASISSNHIAPWRAKGYLCCGEEAVSAKLTTFREELPYTPYRFALSDSSVSQFVQADYVIKQDAAAAIEIPRPSCT